MEKISKEEGNKLIAYFMGAKGFEDVSFNLKPTEMWLPFHGIVPIKGLKYCSSYDWLMPVIEKIWKLTANRQLWYIELNEIDPDGFTPTLFNKYHIRENSFESNIEEIYYMAITFIEWYTEFTKK